MDDGRGPNEANGGLEIFNVVEVSSFGSFDALKYISIEICYILSQYFCIYNLKIKTDFTAVYQLLFPQLQIYCAADYVVKSSTFRVFYLCKVLHKKL